MSIKNRTIAVVCGLALAASAAAPVLPAFIGAQLLAGLAAAETASQH